MNSYSETTAFFSKNRENTIFNELKNFRRDGVIYVYSKGSTAPAFQWSKHTASISCLHADNKSGVLLSGSWDNSAVVWPLDNEDPASLVNLNENNTN